MSLMLCALFATMKAFMYPILSFYCSTLFLYANKVATATLFITLFIQVMD
jgi:hypothetical protein